MVQGRLSNACTVGWALWSNLRHYSSAPTKLCLDACGLIRPCHRAEVIQGRFERHHNKSEVLTCSSDLSPITHLWDELVKRVLSLKIPPHFRVFSVCRHRHHSTFRTSPRLFSNQDVSKMFVSNLVNATNLFASNTKPSCESVVNQPITPE